MNDRRPTGRHLELQPNGRRADALDPEDDLPLDEDCDVPRLAYGVEAALEAVECSAGFWVDERMGPKDDAPGKPGSAAKP